MDTGEPSGNRLGWEKSVSASPISASVVPTDIHASRPSPVAFADACSRWLTSAAQTMPTVRQAGTTALDRPSPPKNGIDAAISAITTVAPSSLRVTETEGRAVSSGDMLALRGVAAGHKSQTPVAVQTCAKRDQTDFVASCTSWWYDPARSNLEGSRRVTVTNPDLPLSAADIERTCLPLEQATMLPGAAYTDYAVFQWERANFFRQGWICAGHIEQVASRGQFLTLDAGGENVLVVGDDDGLPRAFLNTCRHRGARLVIQPAGTPPAHPVPVPRLDLRLRRQPQERALHRRPGRLRPEVLLAARDPARGRRGPRAARPLR